jgi:hypothetical protein
MRRFWKSFAAIAVVLATVGGVSMVLAQSPGGLNLQGPVEVPSVPKISPTEENAAINAELAKKVDINGGVATNLKLTGTIDISTSNLPQITIDANKNVHITVGGVPVILAPAATPPGAPTITVAPGLNQNVVSWVDSTTTGGAPITSHSLYRSLVSNGELSTVAIPITGQSPYTDSTAQVGITEFYEMTANNIAGPSPVSNEASGVAIGTVSPPAAPTLVAMSGNGENTISWTDGASNGAPITAHYLYKGLAANGESTTGILISGSSPYTDVAANGVAEYYKLTAVNSAGQSPFSNEATATPQTIHTAPNPPTLAVTPGVGVNIISWVNASTGTAPASHNLYKSLTPNGEGSTPYVTAITGNGPYNDTEPAGTPVYYKLTSVSTGGESSPSNEASGTPTVAQPSSPVVSLNGAGFVWGHQSTVSTTTETGGGTSPIVLTGAATGVGPGVSSLVTPMTGAVGTYTVQLTISHPAEEYFQGGVALLNPTTGQLSLFGEENNQIAVENYTNYSSYAGVYPNIGTIPTPVYGSPIWFRVIYDGINYQFWYSLDGQAADWTEITSQPATTLGNPTEIGINVVPEYQTATSTPDVVTLTRLDYAGGVTNPQLIAPGVTALTAAAPTAPTGVTVTAGAAQNTINATPVVAYPPVTGYTITRSTTSGGENPSSPIATNVQLPFVDTGLSTVEYFYKVAAVSSFATGPYSVEANGTPTSAGSYPAGSAISLVTDSGSTVATIGGSTFGWNNQGTASISGTGTPSSPLKLLDPRHANATNAKSLMTKLASGPATYTVAMDNPNGNGGYNLGMYLYSSTTGKYTLIDDSGANDAASNINVISETSLQGANATNLFTAAAYSQYAVWTAETTYRIDTDGTNVNFSYSLSGTGNTYHILYTTTLAALGNPDHIGLFMDSASTDSSYGTYDGYTDIFGFAATSGDTPQAVGPGDATNTFLTTVNYPTTNILPQIPGSVPYGNPSSVAGLTPYFDMIFGTSGVVSGETVAPNITSSTQFRNYIYTNYLEGNYGAAIGSPQDTGQGYGEQSAFFSVNRTYPVGDPNDLIPVEADGLHVKALCAQNHNKCTPEQIYAGYYRIPAYFRPGMVLEFDYIPPVGYHSWFTTWLFTGMQLTPYPNNNPYGTTNNGTPLAVSGSNGHEIDLNDDFALSNTGCSSMVNGQLEYGAQLDFATPYSYYGETYSIAPHTSYSLGSGNWNNGYFWCQTNYVPRTVRHLVADWNGNYITILIDGTIVAQGYMEYNVNGATGPVSSQANDSTGYTDVSQAQLGMVWNVGGEVVPVFQTDILPAGGNGCTFNVITNECGHPTVSPLSENDGFGEQGWGGIVLRQAAWFGHLSGLPTGG